MIHLYTCTLSKHVAMVMEVQGEILAVRSLGAGYIHMNIR